MYGLGFRVHGLGFRDVWEFGGSGFQCGGVRGSGLRKVEGFIQGGLSVLLVEPPDKPYHAMGGKLLRRALNPEPQTPSFLCRGVGLGAFIRGA